VYVWLHNCKAVLLHLDGQNPSRVRVF